MHKFVICITVLFLIICCCGCGGGEKINAVSENISFTARIELDGEKYQFDCVTGENKEITMSVKTPAQISGLAAVYGENGQHLEYKGMKREFEIGSSRFTSITDYISTIRSISGQNADKSGYEYVLKKNIGSNECIIHLSPGGTPLKITAEDMEIVLMDFTIIKK